MPDNHTRSSKAHDLPGVLPLGLFVAVHRTLSTGGLRLAIGTFLQSLAGVIEKGLAFCADRTSSRFWRVLGTAPDTHHRLHGPEFTAQPPPENWSFGQ